MKVPTLAEFAIIIEHARMAGREAAIREANEVAIRSATFLQAEDLPGGSTLTIFADGRTKLGKLLAKIDRQIPGLDVYRALYGGWAVIIQYMVGGEAASISVAADKAALKVLEDELGVTGAVMPYFRD